MDEVIFDKTLAVTFKSLDRDGSCKQGRISLHVVTATTTSPVYKTELQVRLTSEDDPYFLHSLSLKEEDFQTLKTQQGLLVDFTAFPQKFVDLLQQCLHNETSEQPKFLLQFVSEHQQGCSLLNIIEANPFKHLTHLSLRFVAGNDAAVKRYLAECLQEVKEQNAVLRERFRGIENDLTMRLSRSDEGLKSQTAELESLRADWKSHTNSLMSNHAQELTAEKEKSFRALTECQQKFEEEKRDTERCHQTKSRDYETRITELQSSNRELTEHKYKAESSIHELKTKLSSSEEECQRLRQELQTLRCDNSSLDATCHDRDKIVHQLKTRLAVLEQEVKDKEDVVSRTSSLLQTTSEQKVKTESLLEQKQRDAMKLESVVKSLSSEVMKGNDIIQRLQNELKSYKDKVKLKSVVTTKQEMLIREKDSAVERQTQELSALSLRVKGKDDEIANLRESLSTCEARLDEREQQLKTNENVISYLNHQINDKLLERSSFPTTGVSSHDVVIRPLCGTFPVVPTTADVYLRKPLGTHPITNQLSTAHLSGGQHKVTFKPHLRKSGIPLPSKAANCLNPALPTVLENRLQCTENHTAPYTTSLSPSLCQIDAKYLSSTSSVEMSGRPSVASYQSTASLLQGVSPQQMSDLTIGSGQRNSPKFVSTTYNTTATDQVPQSGLQPSATGQPSVMSAYFPH